MASIRKKQTPMEFLRTPTTGPRARAARIRVVAQGNDSLASDIFRIINERIRLGILSSLAVNTRLSFAELKTMLDTTDGNLSMHARKLEDAGFIKAAKTFRDRRPLTEFVITASGREGLLRYLNHMEVLISRMKEEARSLAAPTLSEARR